MSVNSRNIHKLHAHWLFTIQGCQSKGLGEIVHATSLARATPGKHNISTTAIATNPTAWIHHHTTSTLGAAHLLYFTNFAHSYHSLPAGQMHTVHCTGHSLSPAHLGAMHPRALGGLTCTDIEYNTARRCIVLQRQTAPARAQACAPKSAASVAYDHNIIWTAYQNGAKQRLHTLAVHHLHRLHISRPA